MSRRFSGQALQAARINARLSREHIALAVDRSWHVIYSYETGRALPSVPVLAALADTLGCRIDDFFTADGAASSHVA